MGEDLWKVGGTLANVWGITVQVCCWFSQKEAKKKKNWLFWSKGTLKKGEYVSTTVKYAASGCSRDSRVFGSGQGITILFIAPKSWVNLYLWWKGRHVTRTCLRYDESFLYYTFEYFSPALPPDLRGFV